MAALAFGAVIFQAAQSLQVPAYSPALVGLWAAGALAHAYAFRALVPLVVGVVTGVGWWIWQPLWDDGSVAGAVVGFGTAGVAAISPGRRPRSRTHPLRAGMAIGRRPARHGRPLHRGGALHHHRRLRVERLAGRRRSSSPPSSSWPRSCSPAAGPVSSRVVADRRRLAAAVLMVLWDTGTDTSDVDAADWAHAAVGVVAFVALAVALVGDRDPA